jgi:septum formation protein
MRGPMISTSLPLLLGSQSPRRKDILESLRIPFTVLPADVPEHVEPGETPAGYLERIVDIKLSAVARRVNQSPRPFSAILVADTVVVLGTAILGKPSDIEDAVRLLTDLCGRSHQVITRYAVAGRAPFDRAMLARSVCTEVTLRAASPAQIRRYAESGEGLDKAGAYAAQGLGAFLIERVQGSYTSVVGLPAAELVADLGALGLLGEYP